MEIEDFDDDDVLPPAQPTTRPAMGYPSTQGTSAARRGNIENFGLASEAAVEESAGLAAELQRLDVQPTNGFGLEAEASRPSQAARAAGGLPTLPRGRSTLQPLGGASGGPRAGPGLLPLRPPPPMAPPPPQDPEAFGLAAEADAVARPDVLGLQTVLPASQPLPAPAFGLANEVDLRAPLVPTRDVISRQPPQPSPPRQPWQQAVLAGNYGLERDVQDAAATGELPLAMATGPALPAPGGYGLAGEIQAAGMAQPLPQGQFVAGEEFVAGGTVPGSGVSPMPLPLIRGGVPFTMQQPVEEQGYGLENDIQQEQQLLQMWSRPLDGTVSLEQLAQQLTDVPEEQRWLHMEARQAERIMIDLARQGVVPRVVDLKNVREKLIEASNPPRLAYLATLEQATQDKRLPPNCRPSLLQAKLKSGQNRLRKLLDPVLDPGGQGFVDLSYTPDGALLPETSRVWQFGLSLVQADGVGKTGLQRVRQPCLFIARLALFDRRANRFLGNILGLRPEAVSDYDKRWEFDPNQRIIVRCGCVQSDPQAGTRLVTDDALSVFVEFNISYRLAVQDTVNMPQSEQKCSKLLDEVNTCWAMISFKKCITLTREVEITVPLYHGSIYEPQPMAAFYADKRSKASFWSTAFKAKESPVLQFRVGPLNLGKPPLVPYAYMPTTMLATHDLGTALGAYRMSLTLTLARQPGPFAAASDPVLAGFPPLLSDHHLLAEFLTRWRDLTTKMTAVLDSDRGCCSPEVLPPLSAMVEAFRRCTIELAPLAYCPTIPPRHINNFVEYQGHRLRLVQHYCHVLDPRSNKILGQRNPVEPLSHSGFEYLHAPFDVSEIRLCMADRLERPEPFYRH
ncbi:hypothetical protein Vafri_19136 [Volvox africanus]|uniref:Uncharacterized protein n=1 Tax=Volvox africanus TaxID=51714 RepID=A0A8J4BNZ0_9CHLO|nr:hypothetical protein Vafri_19136 [Volvox africanus]